MSQQIMPYPRGIGRTIMRMPLYLHRYGLGALMRPFPYLILTTQGHISGLPRHVVLEYRRHGSRFYVISGWGKRPHWYQNIVVNPEVTLQIGSREQAATAHLVDDPAEALRAVYMFQRTSRLAELILANMSSASTLDLRTLTEVSDEFTVVRFDVRTGQPRLPGIRPTQAWLGPLVLVIVMGFMVRMVLTRLADD